MDVDGNTRRSRSCGLEIWIKTHSFNALYDLCNKFKNQISWSKMQHTKSLSIVLEWWECQSYEYLNYLKGKALQGVRISLLEYFSDIQAFEYSLITRKCLSIVLEWWEWDSHCLTLWLWIRKPHCFQIDLLCLNYPKGKALTLTEKQDPPNNFFFFWKML